MLDNLSALMSVTLGGSVCILLFLAAGPAVQAFHTPLAVLCLGSAGGGADLVPAVPRHAPKVGGLERLVQLSIPQAVSENAYDRENARNRDWEEIQKTGNGRQRSRDGKSRWGEAPPFCPV